MALSGLVNNSNSHSSVCYNNIISDYSTIERLVSYLQLPDWLLQLMGRTWTKVGSTKPANTARRTRKVLPELRTQVDATHTLPAPKMLPREISFQGSSASSWCRSQAIFDSTIAWRHTLSHSEMIHSIARGSHLVYNWNNLEWHTWHSSFDHKVSRHLRA